MKLNFPSLTYLGNQALKGFLRFPLTILSGLFSAVIIIYLIENGKDIDNLFPYLNFMLCSFLGIPLFFGIQTYAEKHGWSHTGSWLANTAGILILVLIYFSFPNRDSTFNTYASYVHYAIYNVCIHLMVSFAPFLQGGEINGFWQYNKKLFLRFWASALYSGFLYVGLVIALLSLDSLFDYKIVEERYAQLLVLIVALFNTWFFVSGIPDDLNELENVSDYPKGLKIFTQYILFPLLILYVLILYAYTSKILINWDWPAGILSFLIIFVAILGILCILLMYPFGKEEGNKWITTFSKTYYAFLIPLIILLFWAVNMRFSAYGMTIPRFVVFLIAGWLSFIAIYFLSGGKNIKIIPSSLAFSILICSVGPWSMFSVSEDSQVKRIENILEEHGILADGKIVNEHIWGDSIPSEYDFNATEVTASLPDSVWNELRSAMIYLDDFHGFDGLKPWFKQDLDSIMLAFNANKKGYLKRKQAIFYMESMGLASFLGTMSSGEEIASNYYSYSLKFVDQVEVKGFDSMLGIYFYFDSYPDKTELKISNDSFIVLQKDGYNQNQLNIAFSAGDTLRIPLNALISKLIQGKGNFSNELGESEMSLDGENESRIYRLRIDELQLLKTTDTLKAQEIRAKLLWSRK